MTAEQLTARHGQIEAAIAALEAEGREVSNAAVYAIVRGHRAIVTRYMKGWRAAGRPEAVMAVGQAERPPVPSNGHAVPVPAPASTLPLLADLARQHTAAQRALEAAQQRVDDVAVERHRARWAGFTALDRLRHAVRVARTAQIHEVQAAFARLQVTQRALAALVGSEDAAHCVDDPTYVPKLLH